MLIYAGIDEAGYGPLFGPLVIGCSVFAIPKLDSSAPLPNMWQRLSKSVCKNLANRKGRLPVNDSKKLTGGKSKIKHLELSCLSFARLTDDTLAKNTEHNNNPFTENKLDKWLSWLGEDCHNNLSNLDWYRPKAQLPWQDIPAKVTQGEISIASAMLKRTCQRIGIEIIDMGAAVILEDKFNKMVSQSRSKAATSFTFIAAHLQSIWNKFGEFSPTVVVDRQGGRTRYLKMLMDIFPHSNIKIVQESSAVSTYKIQENNRAITIHFQVAADGAHMPTALASMVAKYTRELMMMRFNDYFTLHYPKIKPTAGYGKDGKRFWQQIQPYLSELNIDPASLKRIA